MIRLLAPRWVLVHLLFLAAVVAACWLGWWQWERAHEAGGSFQNLGYALQWPLFGAFAGFLWYQVVRMYGPGNGASEETVESQDSEDESLVASQQADIDGASSALRSAGSSGAQSGRKRRLVPPPAPQVDADEDPELAAYNEYLAELNQRGEQS